MEEQKFLFSDTSDLSQKTEKRSQILPTFFIAPSWWWSWFFGWLSGYQLADEPTRPSYSVSPGPDFSEGLWWPIPAESQRFLVKILHFDLSRKAEKPNPFFFLLILRFGDEVDFSAGFPARPVGSLRATKPIRLAARPTRSSYSVFHITVDSLGRTWVPFRLVFRQSAGWWAYSAILLSRPSAYFS